MGKPIDAPASHLRRMTNAKLSIHEERRVAVVAGVDPRSVRAFIAGRSMRSTTASRVEQALRDTGHAALIPSASPASTAA